MQSQITVKSLIEGSLNGNFKNVYKCINSKQVKIETNSAIKIIVAVCNACHKNLSTPQNINEQDLLDLAKCLMKFIQIPSNENYEQYAQSAFYILKLLIEKKNLDCILQLESFLLPHFMPLILTEKLYTTYQSISKSMYNLIVVLTQTKDKQNSERILKLCYLLSSIYKKIDKKTSLCESVHNCILGLIILNISSDKLVQFYIHALHLVDRIEDLSLYPLLINNLSIIYTHLLKNGEYNLVSSCYKTALNHLRHLFKGNEYILLWEVVEIVEYLNPGSKSLEKEPAKCHNSLKTYYRNYRSTPSLQSVCDFISSVASIVLQLYKKNKQWVQRAEVHTNYYTFLNDVALIMEKTPYSCPCKKCSTKTNLNEALRTLNSIGGLGRLCIVNKTDVTRNYKLEILRYLEKFTTCVSTLKDSNCQKWERYWYDLGVHLYSIGVHLYQNKDTEMTILYLQKFIQCSLEFEGQKPTIVENTYLCSALNSVAGSYFETQDYVKCLLFSSLGIILNDSPKNEINRWLRAKAMLREKSIADTQELQELTLVSVLEKYQTELTPYLPKSGLTLDTKRKIELLVYELRQYNAKWKSKIPMCAVFAELSKLASSQFSAEVFIEIWGDGDMLVHETLPKLLQDTIRKVEVEKIPKKDLLLAHLYFLQHRYRVKDTIVKHCDEMERTLNLTKVNDEVVNGIVPPDPNDECDLISSYECLKLSRYVIMMKELNKSLDLVHSWLPNNSIESGKEKDRLYKLLANIGHEYQLHNNSTKSLQAWELALKVADNPLQKLQATGFLVELGDVRKSLLQKWMDEAEKDVNLLRFNKNFEELITYFLCKAEGYFYVDFEKAYSSFREALKFQEECQVSNMLQARIYLLHHKFIMLPCKYGVEGHREYSLVRIHQANNFANLYYTSTTSTSSYDMRIFFDIYETLAKMYHDLHLPREVRCYARDSVVIAQKMVLPLRTTSLLYYLTYADINTCRLDDCRVKMNDFSNILGLTKTRNISNVPAQSKGKEKIDAVEDLVGGFKEMVLDIPERVPKTLFSGSPSFTSETFKSPLFLDHEESCECFYCMCLEYHQFVLKKTFLNALMYVYENDLSSAKDFFNGCIKICETLLKRKYQNYNKKISKKVTPDLLPPLREKIIDTHCLTMIEYAKCLIRSERFDEAKDVNVKVLDTLQMFGLKFSHIYNEALALKMNIIARSLFEQPQIKTAAIEQAVVNVKTPPSKQSHVLISPACATGPVETIRVIPKLLKFDLSDTEDETEEKKSNLPKNLPPPFLNLGMKTPAPSSSKVKIYTNNKSGKKTKNKPLIEIPQLKEIEVSTPSSVDRENVPQQLASRTKLLTERLKNSTRKGSGVNDEDVKKKSAMKAGVKQNLLSQLNDADAEQNGAVRRSTRNTKK